MRTLVAVMLLTLSLSWSVAARARPPRIGTIHTVSINQVTKPPTFYARVAPRLVDRGRLLYLGHGMWKEQARIRLLEVKTGKERWIEAPLAAYLEARQRDFPGLSGAGWPGLGVRRLLFYDGENGEAGILAQDRHGRQRKDRRQLYLHWDLRAKRITGHAVLGVSDAQHLWFGIKPIGYHPHRKRLHLQIVSGLAPAGGGISSGGASRTSPGLRRAPRRVRRPKATRFEIQVLALAGAKVRTLTRFVNGRKLFPGPYVDRPHRRALLVEYAERPIDHQRPPQGFIVDLERGGVRAVTIPGTCYGASFSEDGKRLLAYSNQTGELWAIKLSDGSQQRVVKLPKRGWVLGAPGDGRYQFLIHPKGIEVLHARRLSVVRRIPRRRFGKGFFHVEGSSIAAGLLVIRNGRTVHVVRTR